MPCPRPTSPWLSISSPSRNPSTPPQGKAGYKLPETPSLVSFLFSRESSLQSDELLNEHLQTPSPCIADSGTAVMLGALLSATDSSPLSGICSDLFTCSVLQQIYIVALIGSCRRPAPGPAAPSSNAWKRSSMPTKLPRSPCSPTHRRGLAVIQKAPECHRRPLLGRNLAGTASPEP
jgi:hypothetical protein